MIRLALLHLAAIFWRRRHAGAKQFRIELERQIAYERRRAQSDVEETEVLMRRAALAIVAHQADKTAAARIAALQGEK